MANLLDRRALKTIFDTANTIRKADQHPVTREVAVYLAREDRKSGGKPPHLVTKAHNAIHGAAIGEFGGLVMAELPDGLVACFSNAFDALKSALHALHAIDLMDDVMVLRGSHVAVVFGQAEVVERPFRDIAGAALERAGKIIGRASMGQVVVEPSLLESLKPPLRFGDVEILQPKRGKIPALGNLTTIAIKPIGLRAEQEAEFEEVDAELRSRGRR